MILYRITSFLRYFFKATNAHGIHSPFVYNLYTTIINTKKHYYAFDDIDAYRKHLSKNTDTINLIELGAGAKKQPHQVVVKNIYKSSCHSKKDTQLLFKLVDYFQPQYIVELGTCLGVSSLYLSMPIENSYLYTFEGNPDYANIASQAFYQSTLKTKNIHIAQDKTFIITEDFIEDIINKEKAKFKDELNASEIKNILGDNIKIIDKNIIHTKINGYTLKDNISKKTKVFDAILCIKLYRITFPLIPQSLPLYIAPASLVALQIS